MCEVNGSMASLESQMDLGHGKIILRRDQFDLQDPMASCYLVLHRKQRMTTAAAFYGSTP